MFCCAVEKKCILLYFDVEDIFPIPTLNLELLEDDLCVIAIRFFVFFSNQWDGYIMDIGCRMLRVPLFDERN